MEAALTFPQHQTGIATEILKKSILTNQLKTDRREALYPRTYRGGHTKTVTKATQNIPTALPKVSPQKCGNRQAGPNNPMLRICSLLAKLPQCAQAPGPRAKLNAAPGQRKWITPKHRKDKSIGIPDKSQWKAWIDDM